MNEDFVSFDLAKKLKEKGYPQKPDNMSCMPYYEYDEVGNHAALCNEIVWHMSTEPRDTIFAAPAIHKVLKWLREKKNLYVEVHISMRGGWYNMIYEISPRRGFDLKHMLIEEKSYEDAAIAGIEYCLDNLI